MTTKEKLLMLLESRKGAWVSGEEIAEELALSRTAVWKAVKALRGDGYEIDAAQNKGYSLSQATDILSAAGIGKYMNPQTQVILQVLPSAPSTNSLLRDLANTGASEGTAVIANCQTQGRGRMGRSFFSPPDTGVYLSLLLRPEEFSPEQAVRVTTMAAVAASRAIERVSGRATQIKWVNDVFQNGRKVCGILTEGAYNLETGSLDYVILGVGINVYEPKDGFPVDIAKTAGAVFSEQQSNGKNQIVGTFLNDFMEIYSHRDRIDYGEEYRKRSFVIGKEIDVITPAGQRSAVALDVDRECRLIVRYEDGTIAHLSSAEVSIRSW